MIFLNEKGNRENLILSHPFRFLLILFILGIVIRFSLSYLFRQGPSIQIDESLYINIAQSLAAGNGIAYRSQPVPYMYIFYPLLLTPLYLFPLPFDLYRVIQLYNTVLISSSCFPIYLFANDFTNSKRKGILAAGLTLLMPDMQMAGFLMSENLVWPLSLWLIFFSYRFFKVKRNSIVYGIMTGVLSALLFWTKPGSFAMGFFLLFSALIISCVIPQYHHLRSGALTGLSVLFGLILLFYCLYVFGFGYEMSVLGLYKKQLTVISAKWFAAVAEFSFLQLLLFAISCGGFFFVIPYACIHEYKEVQRVFLFSFTGGLVAMSIGTAAFVDMFGWNGSFINPQLHLRYMAVFVPVMFVFSLATILPEQRKSLVFSLAAMAVLTVFPGAFVGFVEGDSTRIDSLALSAWLKPNYIPYVVGNLLTLLVVLFILSYSFLLMRKRLSSGLAKFPVFFLIFFLIYNNTCAYFACSTLTDDTGYGRDAVQMNSILENLSEEALIITQSHYNEILSYCLECRMRKPHQMVTSDTLFTAFAETGGFYKPFVPEDQDPNVGNHLTPDTGTFLFGITVADLLEFSPFVEIQKSDNNWYTIAQVPTGSRVVDTMVTGIDMNILSEGESAQFYVFDESRFKNGRLSLSLVANALESPVTLLIENAGKTQTLSLSSNPFPYKISLRPGNTIITSNGGDSVILSYSTS